jgi:hypothetical protein
VGKLDRKYMGVRVGFVLVAVLVYFGTLGALALFPELDQATTWNALEWLVGAIGAAVIGDTVRPSGMKVSAFHVERRPSETFPVEDEDMSDVQVEETKR